MTQKTCVAQHVCDLYFTLTFCDLALAFLSIAIVPTRYPSQTFARTLSGFEPFAALLTDPRAQNVKTLHFDL